MRCLWSKDEEAPQSRWHWIWPLKQRCFLNRNAAGAFLKVQVSAGIRVRYQGGTW